MAFDPRRRGAEATRAHNIKNMESTLKLMQELQQLVGKARYKADGLPSQGDPIYRKLQEAEEVTFNAIRNQQQSIQRERTRIV